MGRDFRENLITVPSCREHNGRKSGDDEFLLVCLAGIIGNNSIGYRHKFTKVDRAMKRTSGRLLDKAFRSREHRHVRVGENRFLEVIWGTPDAYRLQKCLDHIVRALHFNHFRTKFDGSITTLFSYLAPPDKETVELLRLLKDLAERDLVNSNRDGANQDVFFYSR